MKTWYIVEIEDDNIYPDKIKVTLYDPTEPGFYGEKLASTSVPSEKHIAIGALTVFATQYGNPDDKPALRKVDSTEGTLCVSRDGSRLAWLPDDDHQGA